MKPSESGYRKRSLSRILPCEHSAWLSDSSPSNCCLDISAFNRVFDLDKEKYGNPSDTDYDVIQPGNVEGWFKTIDKYAAAAQKANKKRKRAPA